MGHGSLLLFCTIVQFFIQSLKQNTGKKVTSQEAIFGIKKTLFIASFLSQSTVLGGIAAASAKYMDRISSLSDRSAIVRDHFKMR